MMNSKRYIIHVDIDAFFASVEVLLDPTLKGKPVVVGGMPHERGVASTCSYEARKFGVHSGMPLRKCYELCPQAVFVRGNHHIYRSFSENFFRILHEFSPDVEEASLDEAYLDFSRCGRMYPSFREAALAVKKRVEERLGITVSVGAAPNKVLAKLATGRAKPAGFFEIEEGRELEYLAPMPIEELPGIGPKTQVVMRMMNIQTLGDLWKLSRPSLKSLFGQSGEELYLQSRGIDFRPLAAPGRPKSVSRETTFMEDLWDRDLLLAHLAYLCDRLAAALREDGLYAHVIEVKARYSDFRTEGRRRLFSSPLREMDRIYPVAEELFLELISGSRLALRLVGVKASELAVSRPLGLFESYTERPEKLGRALDSVREKHGFGAVLTGREKMLDACYALDGRRGYVLKTASLTK